jgi:hypothetical protein
MIIRHTRDGAVLAALTLVVGTLFGCAETPSPPPASGGDVAGQAADVLPLSSLRLGLLRDTDVPTGYLTSEPQDLVDSSSTPPECAETLNELELDRPADVRASQVRASFARSGTGPWIQEILRSYPRGGAESRFDAAVAVLESCPRFLVDAAPFTFVETVTPLELPPVGSESWAGEIVTESDALSLTEHLVLSRVETFLVVLDVLDADRPDPAETASLARTAADRVAALDVPS